MRNLTKNQVTFHMLKEDNDEFIQAMQLFAETFKTEAITAYTYNFDHKQTEKQFYEATLLNARVYLARGHDIIIAKSNDAIVGIAVIKKTIKGSFASLLKIVVPKIFNLFPLVTKVKYKNAVAISKAMRLSQPLKEKHVTLSAIAVSAKYQGQGIGKRFLNEVHQRYAKDFEAVYLYTADKKNKEIYSRAGYAVIEQSQTSDFDMYHMLYRF